VSQLIQTLPAIRLSASREWDGGGMVVAEWDGGGIVGRWSDVESGKRFLLPSTSN